MNRKIATAVVALVLAAAAGYGLVTWYGRTHAATTESTPVAPAEPAPATPHAG